MQIAIDRGNTQTKVSIAHDGTLSDFRVMADSNLPEELSRYIAQHQPSHCILSDVRSEQETEELLRVIPMPCMVLSHQLKLPFTISYTTPDSLGRDRLANAAGAVARFAEKDVLVIDCGTCITYTFISGSILHGGSITPGIHLRFRALHDYTGRLPLIAFNEAFNEHILGASTQDSIEIGVLQGIIAETDGMIERYREQHPQLIVILTGGDASFFEKHLKSSIFAAPHLTQEGLHEILQLNCA